MRVMYTWDVRKCCCTYDIIYFRFSLCSGVDYFEFQADLCVEFCNFGKV